MKTLYRKLFELEQWRIGVVDQTLAEVFQRGIRSEQVTWFPCHQYDFVADPFLFSLKGKPYLACEIFNYFSAKGKLRCYDLNGQEYLFLMR
ncbi:hypothetical protein [Vibrio cincinnatiensis]|uniref:hypothetical protein n=1 Tax=Vibrio cincinnatiensis TaxID=675 RepID=UPI001EDDD83D|nr:hypothetical protein [Vibrio cincinnatiensis]